MQYILFYRIICLYFFFNDTATTEIYTLSLHDALPISVGGLEHRGAGGVGAVVADDLVSVGADRLGLADDVEVAAGVELQVDVAERLEPGAELALGAAHALGHGAHLAGAPGEHGDDPVGLAELLGAQHDALVAVERLRGGGHQQPRPPVTDRSAPRSPTLPAMLTRPPPQ